MHYFKSIGEFKPELQSGNAQFGSKLAIFCPVWLWNLMDNLGKQEGTSSILHPALCIISNPWVNSNWSYSPETLNSGQNRQFFVPCDLEIWWMNLKTIGHFFYITLSFVHHFKAMDEFKLELQSGNAQFGSKSAIFCPVWPWNLTDDLKKQYSTFIVLLQALCIIAIDELKLELQSENAQFGSKSLIFQPVWPWNLTDDLEKLECAASNGNRYPPYPQVMATAISQ